MFVRQKIGETEEERESERESGRIPGRIPTQHMQNTRVGG